VAKKPGAKPGKEYDFGQRPALLLVDVLFGSANALLDDSKIIAFGSHLIAPKVPIRGHLIVFSLWSGGFLTVDPLHLLGKY
jgi:hypothetical protein